MTILGASALVYTICFIALGFVILARPRGWLLGYTAVIFLVLIDKVAHVLGGNAPQTDNHALDAISLATSGLSTYVLVLVGLYMINKADAAKIVLLGFICQTTLYSVVVIKTMDHVDKASPLWLILYQSVDAVTCLIGGMMIAGGLVRHFQADSQTSVAMGASVAAVVAGVAWGIGSFGYWFVAYPAIASICSLFAIGGVALTSALMGLLAFRKSPAEMPPMGVPA